MLNKSEVDFFFALSVLDIANVEGFFQGIQIIKQKVALMSHVDMMNLLFTQVPFALLDRSIMLIIELGFSLVLSVGINRHLATASSSQ